MEKRRILSLVLAALMLLSVLALAACSDSGKKPDGSDTTAPAVTAPTADTTVPEETTAPDPALIDDLPKDVKFDGETFTVLSHNHDAAAISWQVIDIYTEEENGERINDAVYARNLAMEERFGVKVQQQLEGTPSSVMQLAINSGSDEFSVYQTTVQSQATAATSGWLVNLLKQEYMDFDKAWWDRSANSSLSFDGRMYYAIGDSQLNALRATWAVFFNKKLIGDVSEIPNLYDVVREGKWTLDLLREYGQKIQQDVDGDGNMTWKPGDSVDIFGLGLQDEVVLPLVLGTGEHIITIENGTVNYNLGSDRIMTAMERVWGFLNEDNTWIVNANRYSYTNLWIEFRNLFMQDQMGFFMGHLSTPVLIAGEMQSDFGILPFPKVFEEQKEYYSTFQYNNAHALSIPKTADLKKTPLLTEAYTMLSHDTVRPAFYDFTLTLRASRDVDSGEMLDIIYSNRNLDLSLAYNGSTNLQSTLQSAATAGAFKFASTEAKLKPSLTKTMEKIVENLEKVDG